MTEAEKERAAVVAWLKELANIFRTNETSLWLRLKNYWILFGLAKTRLPAATIDFAVRGIENGLHLKSGEHLKDGR